MAAFTDIKDLSYFQLKSAYEPQKELSKRKFNENLKNNWNDYRIYTHIIALCFVINQTKLKQ